MCCVSVLSILCFLTAFPPTKAILKDIFKRTSDLDSLCGCLEIPDYESESAAAEYFAQNSDPTKVRNMIFWLDWNGDTVLADTMMEYAEPPAGNFQRACAARATVLGLCVFLSVR